MSRELFVLFHLYSIYFVIQTTVRANESFRGKTRCLSVLSEGSSVLWTTEHEGSRVYKAGEYISGCSRDPSLRSGWQCVGKTLKNSLKIGVTQWWVYKKNNWKIWKNWKVMLIHDCCNTKATNPHNYRSEQIEMEWFCMKIKQKQTLFLLWDVN